MVLLLEYLKIVGHSLVPVEWRTQKIPSGDLWSGLVKDDNSLHSELIGTKQ